VFPAPDGPMIQQLPPLAICRSPKMLSESSNFIANISSKDRSVKGWRTGRVFACVPVLVPVFVCIVRGFSLGAGGYLQATAPVFLSLLVGQPLPQSGEPYKGPLFPILPCAKTAIVCR